MVMPDHLATVFRQESGRCTATLIRILGDVDLAEDAVAEAFLVAAQRWPHDGIPANPGGWITTTARNWAFDRLRRESSRVDRSLAAQRLQDTAMDDPADPDHRALDDFVDVVPDDQLRLMFLCCHPALSPDAQVALTLRLLGGLGTPEIARAFVVPDSTIAQRIVRAKRKLRDNNAAFRIPSAGELPDRLDVVRACLRRNRPGPFQIQAAIAAVHADAPTSSATDWNQIVALYDQLYAQRPDNVVALNPAVAVAEAHGSARGVFHRGNPLNTPLGTDVASPR